VDALGASVLFAELYEINEQCSAPGRSRTPAKSTLKVYTRGEVTKVRSRTDLCTGRLMGENR
jgi:hypothetical protein